jgi:hypothetical protein
LVGFELALSALSRPSVIWGKLPKAAISGDGPIGNV